MYKNKKFLFEYTQEDYQCAKHE